MFYINYFSSSQDCKEFHQAKDGDGWVEQSFQPVLFGMLHKVMSDCSNSWYDQLQKLLATTNVLWLMSYDIYNYAARSASCICLCWKQHFWCHRVVQLSGENLCVLWIFSVLHLIAHKFNVGQYIFMCCKAWLLYGMPKCLSVWTTEILLYYLCSTFSKASLATVSLKFSQNLWASPPVLSVLLRLEKHGE